MMIRKGIEGYNDNYLLIKAINETKYRAHEDVPFSRFKAKDVIDYQESSQTQNTVVSRKIEELTIETPMMFDFNERDIVVSLKDDKMWRVSKAITADDGEAKRYSNRPNKVTILTLVSG